MATTYTVDDILLTKEDASGDIQTTPTLIRICVNKFDLKESPTFDEKGCLLSDSKIKIKTGTEFAGGATIDMDVNSTPVILTHVMGDAVSVADATAEEWTTATAYVAGDIVNLTTGTWSLVATTGGTTSTPEPTPTTVGEKVTDGTVVWVAQPKLLLYTFDMESSAPTFTVEYHLTDGGSNHFYKQFSGVEISQLPLNVDGGTSVPEFALDFNTTTSIDSEDADWVEDLATITGAKEVSFPRDYYGGDCELTQVKIDDVLVGDFDSASMTIDKQLTTVERLNCAKVATRDLKVEGEMKKDFTIIDYNAFKTQTNFDLKFIFNSLIGSTCTVQFPLVEPLQTDPDFETRDMVYISPTITATDTTTTKIASATCIAPSLYDGTAIIGDGSY